VLVTLGGCHLLDAWRHACFVLACLELVQWGVLCLSHERSQRATLVEARCEKRQVVHLDKVLEYLCVHTLRGESKLMSLPLVRGSLPSMGIEWLANHRALG
jgi:hypothetical protein